MIRFDEVRARLFDAALPLWAERGLDAPGLGFRERLDAAGRPLPAGFKRTRVQARQIYVFSHAALLGWDGPALEAADRGVDFLDAHARLPEGGWARRLGEGGGVLDSTPDLYDQAFHLYAFAWRARAPGGERALALARETWDAVEARFARSDGRGFHAVLPPSGEEQQNPHMHLLEALLAMHETTGEAVWAERAEGLGRLFDTVLFDAESGTLGEFFDADWRPAPGPDGVLVEPGHHFEWVWLLERLREAGGGDRTGTAERLFAFAAAHGVDPSTGLTVDALSRSGRLLSASGRVWCQAERLKALLARAERGRIDGPAIGAVVDLLLDRCTTAQGLWIDRLEPDLTARPGPVPASTFYHLFLAISELLRLRPMLEART